MNLEAYQAGAQIGAEDCAAGNYRSLGRAPHELGSTEHHAWLDGYERGWDAEFFRKVNARRTGVQPELLR